MILKGITTLVFMLSITILNAQEYLGVFENSADQQLYVVQTKPNEAAALLRVENFKETTEAPDVSQTIGAVYSQQYQRVFAVYTNSEELVIAHSVELGDNQAVEIKERFGVVFEPNYQSYFGLVLTSDNRLMALRVTY